MTLLSKVLLGLIALALTLIAAFNTYTIIHFIREPFVVTESAAVNSPVPPGEDLHVRYTAERSVLCKTEADAFVIQTPEQFIALSYRRPAGVIPLGTSSWIVSVMTRELKPGRYVLRFFVYSDCGDRLHTIMVPDIAFEVLGDGT